MGAEAVDAIYPATGRTLPRLMRRAVAPIAGGAEPRLSPHPVDQLIRTLVRAGRAATEGEVERIRERVATAPFDQRVVNVRPEHVGASHGGETLGARADSLTYHWIQRAAVDGQWAGGTTAQEYVEDLRRGALDSQARFALYRARGGHIATVLAETGRVVPPGRRGEAWAPLLVVVYSADRGTIISGYQASRLEKIRIPEDARWLR